MRKAAKFFGEEVADVSTDCKTDLSDLSTDDSVKTDPILRSYLLFSHTFHPLTHLLTHVFTHTLTPSFSQ